MRNLNSFKTSLAWLSVALTCLPGVTRADDIAEKGRAILARNQHAVVTVQLVLKSKFSVSGAGGQSTENRTDVTGTVVDPSGLTVLSLSVTDPGQLIQSMMGGLSEDEMKFKMETELSDVKILLDDGTEIMRLRWNAFPPWSSGRGFSTCPTRQ